MLGVYRLTVMAEQSQTDENPLEQYDNLTAFGVDTNTERFVWFANKVHKEVGRMLTDNAGKRFADENDVETISDVYDGVLSPENVRGVDVEDPLLGDARVTYWLHEAPNWANVADTRKLIDLHGRNDAHVVIDVREF